MKPELFDYFYDFLNQCGAENEIYSFCGAIATGLHPLVPYDQARVIFLEATGKISSSLLYGVAQKNWNRFLDYYVEDTAVSKYSLKRPLHLAENEKVSLCDWTDQNTQSQYSDFESNYVRSLQLKYCLGMGFSDSENCIRCIITLDRIINRRYSEQEMQMIRRVHPLLNHLFAKFFVEPPTTFSQQNFILAETALTRREREIAKLMLSGAAPAMIGERLFCSKNTVYKHIANMYKKLGVSNRQEFFAKLK